MAGGAAFLPDLAARAVAGPDGDLGAGGAPGDNTLNGRNGASTARAARAARAARTARTTCTASTRRRTLRDAWRWNHDLLDDRQRRVFRQREVFRGGFTLVAALAVAEQALAEVRAAGRMRHQAALLALWTTLLAESGDNTGARQALAEALPAVHSAGTAWAQPGW